MKLKKLTISAMLVAVAVVLSSFSIPIGPSRCFPVPSRFLISAVQNAIETPYTGPRNTAASTLHKCWIGKHLLGPIGIENDDNTTATATNMADIVNFFNFI